MDGLLFLLRDFNDALLINVNGGSALIEREVVPGVTVERACASLQFLQCRRRQPLATLQVMCCQIGGRL
jgi:hypothetical protein